MNFANGLKSLCQEEGVNLSEFSALTGIAYSSVRRYAAGTRTPTIEVIEKKILSVSRLEKYRPLLLGSNDYTTDFNDSTSDEEKAEINKMIWLLLKIQKSGRGPEAFRFLKFLHSETKNIKLDNNTEDDSNSSSFETSSPQKPLYLTLSKDEIVQRLAGVMREKSIFQEPPKGVNTKRISSTTTEFTIEDKETFYKNESNFDDFLDYVEDKGLLPKDRLDPLHSRLLAEASMLTEDTLAADEYKKAE